MIIHDVKMYPVATGSQNGFNILAQAGKIRRQDRGCDNIVGAMSRHNPFLKYSER